MNFGSREFWSIRNGESSPLAHVCLVYCCVSIHLTILLRFMESQSLCVKGTRSTAFEIFTVKLKNFWHQFQVELISFVRGQSVFLKVKVGFELDLKGV